MKEKSQQQLLEEFTQEINAMTSEEVMKEIYEELKHQRLDSPEEVFLPVNNLIPDSKEGWINEIPGQKFIEQYNDSPAVTELQEA